MEGNPNEQTGGEGPRGSEPVPARSTQEACATRTPGKNHRGCRLALAGSRRLDYCFSLSQDFLFFRSLQWDFVRCFQVREDGPAVGAADDVLLPGIHFLRKQRPFVIGREG